MGRPKGWTESKFRNFIKSALRSATLKWPPKNEVKKVARTRRGFYLCAECKEEVPASLHNPKGGKRINNIYVDHISPVIDPLIGFVNWDVYIIRMFIDEGGLQVLCKKCHDIKTKGERDLARDRTKTEKAG